MVNLNSQSHFAVGTLGTGMALAGIRLSYDYVMNNLGLNQNEQPINPSALHEPQPIQFLNSTLVQQTNDLFNPNAFTQGSIPTNVDTPLNSGNAILTDVEPHQVPNISLSETATEIHPHQVPNISLSETATEIQPYLMGNLPLRGDTSEVEPYQVAELSLRDNATEIEPYQVADLTLRGNQFELTSGLAGGIVLHQVADLSLRGIGSSVTEGAISLVSTAVQVTESFEPPVFIGDLVMRGAEHITNFAQGPFTHQLTQISEIALSESLSIAQSCPVVNQGLAMVAAGVVIGVGAGFAGYKIAQAVNNRLKANRVKKLDLQEITTQRVVTNNNQMAGKKVRQLVTVNRGVK